MKIEKKNGGCHLMSTGLYCNRKNHDYLKYTHIVWGAYTMKITKTYISQLVKEEMANMNGDAVEQQMLGNLRASAIESLVGVLRDLEQKTDVMGVNAMDITTVIQDCIQKLQENPES